MSRGIELPRRDLLWWILPLAAVSIAVTVRILVAEEAVREGFINPWLLGAAAAALCAAGLWFEQTWARWVGLALAAALVGAATWKFAHDFAVWRLAAIAAFLACGWLLWRLPLGERDDEEPFVSLVLLFREPHYLDASILAQLASRAWGASIDVVDPDEEDPANRGGDDDEPVRSMVGGVMPHFFCFHPPAFFTIHCFDEPYFDDPDDVAEAVPELRAQQAISQHKAWVSVDLIHWMADEENRSQAYRLIGRLLAELADENCLAVLDPGEGRIFVYDPETERKLRSENPLAELQDMYYAPIATIDGDDEQMKAAVAEAKRRWPEFISAFERRDEEGDFLIKAPFSHHDFTEFMWVKVTGIENRVVYGQLGNEPANIPHLHEGDVVRVKEDDINDWMCVLQGKPVGGFTLKVLGRSFEDE